MCSNYAFALALFTLQPVRYVNLCFATAPAVGRVCGSNSDERAHCDPRTNQSTLAGCTECAENAGCMANVFIRPLPPGDSSPLGTACARPPNPVGTPIGPPPSGPWSSRTQRLNLDASAPPRRARSVLDPPLPDAPSRPLLAGCEACACRCGRGGGAHACGGDGGRHCGGGDADTVPSRVAMRPECRGPDCIGPDGCADSSLGSDDGGRSASGIVGRVCDVLADAAVCDARCSCAVSDGCALPATGCAFARCMPCVAGRSDEPREAGSVRPEPLLLCCGELPAGTPPLLAVALPFAAALGRVNVKVEPWPGVLVTDTLPPCAATRSRTMLSPKPKPP